MTCESWPVFLSRAVTLTDDTERWPTALSRAGPGLGGSAGSPLVAAGFSRLGAGALQHSNFRSRSAWFPGSKHRLKGCGPLAQLLCGMWDLPGSGMESTSPALADLPLSHQGSRSTTLSLMKETKQLLN